MVLLQLSIQQYNLIVPSVIALDTYFFPPVNALAASIISFCTNGNTGEWRRYSIVNSPLPVTRTSQGGQMSSEAFALTLCHATKLRRV